jgi:alanine racemase
VIKLFKHVRPVFAEIDLDNLAFNLKGIRSLSKGADMIGVVKADAYLL